MKTLKTISKYGRPFHKPVFVNSDPYPVEINYIYSKFEKQPFPFNYHDELEFQYIKRGAGSYFFDGKLYPFSKNSFLTFMPLKNHLFLPQQGCLIEKTSLYFFDKNAKVM
jgi:hypothetical protein